jgi:hypothetical protein
MAICFFSRAASDRARAATRRSASASAAPGHSSRSASFPGPVTFDAKRAGATGDPPTDRSGPSRRSSDGHRTSRSNHTPSPGTSVEAPSASDARVTEISAGTEITLEGSAGDDSADAFLFAPKASGGWLRRRTSSRSTGTIPPRPSAGFHHATRPPSRGPGSFLMPSRRERAASSRGLEGPEASTGGLERWSRASSRATSSHAT